MGTLGEGGGTCRERLVDTSHRGRAGGAVHAPRCSQDKSCWQVCHGAGGATNQRLRGTSTRSTAGHGILAPRAQAKSLLRTAMLPHPQPHA